MPSSAQHARNFPKTSSQVVAGSVRINSWVPLRRSSLHIRIVSADERKISKTGIHSNIGRTSRIFRAKKASPQKNTNSVKPRNASKNRYPIGDPKN
jgi:hypothetical protein